MKKKSKSAGGRKAGSGRPAAKQRGVKDLAPRKSTDIRGGAALEPRMKPTVPPIAG